MIVIESESGNELDRVMYFFYFHCRKKCAEKNHTYTEIAIRFWEKKVWLILLGRNWGKDLKKKGKKINGEINPEYVGCY